MTRQSEWGPAPFNPAPITFIVRGRTLEGSEVFYTGRAGQSFVSPSRGEAFTYRTLEGAQRRALSLNHGSRLTGIWFMGIFT